MSSIPSKPILTDLSYFDYAVFVYPLHVIATSRMVNSIMSRSTHLKSTSPIRIHKDLALIYQISGPRGFFYGFLPYSLSTLMSACMTKYEKDLGENTTPKQNNELAFYSISLIFVNNFFNMWMVRS